MVDAADQDFLKSIFLLEAWDTLASLEDGAAQLAAGTEPAWNDLFVVTHRLKGAASLHGFPRVAALAGPGEVVVSGTTRDLLDGSGLRLEDRGSHELKGLEGLRQVYVLVRP